MTGDPVTAWSPIAAGRAVSMLLAAKMFDSGVEEMCRTLVDLYGHYADVEADADTPPSLPSLPAVVPAYIADQKPSRAFDLNE